jgi:hypothetical protein
LFYCLAELDEWLSLTILSERERERERERKNEETGRSVTKGDLLLVIADFHGNGSS